MIRPLPLMTIVLLASLSATGAFAQYRWTDANGNVHYGDAPPRDAKDVRSLSARSAAAPAGTEGSSNLPYEVRRAVERAPVVLYTAPECQPCAPAAALLRERGVPYSERTVITPDDVQEFRRLSGGLRLPHVTVGGQSQSGFNPEIWLSLLDAAGYPKGSMLPRTYQWSAPQPLVPPPAKAEAAPPASTGNEQAAAPAPVRR